MPRDAYAALHLYGAFSTVPRAYDDARDFLPQLTLRGDGLDIHLVATTSMYLEMVDITQIDAAIASAEVLAQKAQQYADELKRVKKIVQERRAESNADSANGVACLQMPDTA